MTGADCHIPGCERDGVHVDGNGNLCDRCRQRLENGERPAPTAEPSADERNEPAAGLGSQPAVEQKVYPTDLVDVEQWLTWKPTDGGRKVPRAPYEYRSQPDRFASAQDPDIWTDYDTARQWADALPEHGLAFTIPSREDAPGDPYVLIDYDDVRGPETGTIHPTVRKHLAQADSYADVSTSGTGVHIVCRGELPEDVKSIDAALPAHDDFSDAGIEVYDAGRYMAMTGAHIAGTPVETRPAQDFLDDLAAEYATVPEETPEELTREPVRSREAIADVDTTIDLQAVFDAIQHVQPSDIHLRSPVTEERADGSKSRDPSWASSESGTRLAELDDGWVYRQGLIGLDALQVVALEERLITRETEYPSGEAFWDAVDALRERGAHIPEYIGPTRSDGEPVAVLPSTPKARALGSGWDCTADGRSEQDLTVAEARERTVQAIVDAIESLDRRLVEALPTMGKSYGAVLAAARTGVPMTILTGRGRTEQYEQFVDWCREHGLRYYRLPAFTHDCPCATGEHGEEWEERVMEWYRAGATPQAIHMYAEEVVGRPLPCQAGEGQECPYTSKWRFDAADIDVLIGHYTHAYNRRVTEGRAVAVDELPEGAYEQGFDAGLASAVTTFLQAHEEIPFADYTDLIEHRDDQARRGEALCWFKDRDLERDVEPGLCWRSRGGTTGDIYVAGGARRSARQRLGTGPD